MSSKKNKKKPIKASQPSIRLSQCMIVKNEEKNIEKALGWAKNIAFEQIVVDTGSTDRTVEIAERLGATVFHFEWIDDFAAAKNYAIEQASGDWIAFLDADEYLSPTDAKKLAALLRKINADSVRRDRCMGISCAVVNIDDEGKPIGLIPQIRFFRAVPELRYVGKIHEGLPIAAENVERLDDISIIHTGYSETAFRETGKSVRNVELLRKAIAESPGDYNLLAYLGEALLGLDDEGSLAEAESLFFDVIGEGSNAAPEFRKKAFSHLLEARLESGDFEGSLELGRRAVSVFPEDVDLAYYLGFTFNKLKLFREAFDVLLVSESSFVASSAVDVSVRISAEPWLLFTQLAAAAQGLGDVASLVKYAAMSLSFDKSQAGILAVYIATLVRSGVSDDEIVMLLGRIYNLRDSQDLLLIVNAASKYGAASLANRFAGMIN